jgi:4-hydroxyphenylacetate decarboxylase small subunit
MTNGHKHLDCRNYAPVDVAKGICHRTKDIVLADGDHCEHFNATQKCKFCSHFAAGKEQYIGACTAVVDHPMTYPDLITVTCEQFARKAQA